MGSFKLAKNCNKLLSIILCICMVISIVPFGAVTAFAAGGSGTAASPLLIGTAAELIDFATRVNNGEKTLYAKLTADIDLNPGYVFNSDGTYTGGTSPVSWTPIGLDNSRYMATFDGNHKTVSGIYFIDTGVMCVGLFGAVAKAGIIKNIYVKNGYIKASNGVGGICGSNYGTVENCVNSITVNCSRTLNTGGICGSNVTGAVISNCLNTGSVSGGCRVGGICGYNSESTVKNCLSTGTITMDGSVGDSNPSGAGAICGSEDNSTFINNYYIAGIAIDVNDTPQNGVGGVKTGTSGTSSTTTADTTGIATIASSSLTTGQACVLLNTNNAGAWRQNLGDDSIPVTDSTRKNVYFNDMDYDFYSNYPTPMLENGYYQIDSAEKLFWLADAVKMRNLNVNSMLTASINLNPGFTFFSDGSYTGTGTPVTWTPITYSDTGIVYNNGIFNGGGYTISGIYINDSTKGYQGLFGSIKNTIKNVRIINSYIKCGSDSGGICAQSTGTIENCSFEGTITGSGYIGGICGDNRGTIKNCRNIGNVTGSQAIAGICALNGGTIQNCFNTGDVTGVSDYAGAVCGRIANGKVTNCYYLEGSATNGSGVVKPGVGDAGSGTKADVVSKTNTQFFSGEVAYLLNGSVNPIATVTPVWYQNVSVNEYPSFNSSRGRVYRYEILRCNNTSSEPPVYGYTNSIASATDKIDVHHYVNGFCSVCNSYEPATLVTASNYKSLGLSSSYVGYYSIQNAGQLFWFSEAEKSNSTISGVLKGNINLNIGYTFNFEAASGLVKVEKNGTLVGYLGTGMKGTSENTSKALASGKWFSDTLGTAMTAPADLKIWTPIGSKYNYTGAFDGNGYTVSGMYYSGNDFTDNSSYAGLFKVCNSSSKICNVSVANSYIFGYRYLAGICGKIIRGTIENCTSSAIICCPSGLSSETYVGGICGFSDSSTISNCGNNGVLSANSYVGGICGSSDLATVSNCYSGGIISASKTTGGICGYNSGTIQNCYTTDALTGTSTQIGAVCGYSQTDKVTNCYYLKGSATNGSGGAKIGIGDVSSDTVGVAESKTNAQFYSGEVTYFLNGSVNPSADVTPVWYQNVSANEYPSFNSARGSVYRYEILRCNSTSSEPHIYGYTNSESNAVDKIDTHHYVNGFCSVCDSYEPATLVTESNYTSLKLSLSYVGYYCIQNAGQLYWFAEEESGKGTINGVLSDDIYLNKGYTFNFEASSGLVKVEKKGTLVGYLGTGIKGTTENTSKALTPGKWFSDTLGTDMTAPTDLNAWTPIGRSISYKGIFDGNGHTVSGMYFFGNDFTDNSANAALFGKCNTGAKICNVNVTNSYIFGYQYLAGICANMQYIAIENCMSSAIICGPSGVSANTNAGGICGYSAGSSIINCGSNGVISAKKRAGGICGDSNNNTITNCYNTGIVSGDLFCGGIYGYNTDSTVTNCYNLDIRETTSIAGVTPKTSKQFTSGEVAWLLNGSVNPSSSVTPVWYQNVNANEYPSLNSERGSVYRYEILRCNSTSSEPPVYGYTNSESNAVDMIDTHHYVNGFCSVCDSYEPAKFNDNGTADSPTDDYYEIGNAGQLYWFAAEVNRGQNDISANLTENIVVNSGNLSDYNGTDENSYRNWTPIGTNDKNYIGTFDGNNKTISGLYYKNTSKDYVGLFGYISGKVKNLGVINSYIKGNKYVGGISGYNTGNIEKCYNTGTINGNEDVGGICGYNCYKIIDCYNSGAVTGEKIVGGVCGYLKALTISCCYNNGKITQNNKTNSAGIVGIKEYGNIIRCYYLDTSATCGINANVDGTYGNISPSGEAESKTVEQFASGEVAYSLNNSYTDGDQSFYQNINTNKAKDSYPRFSGETVYQINGFYTNSPYIGSNNNTQTEFDFTNHYIITNNLGVTSLDMFLINAEYSALRGIKAKGTTWGTGSTVKLIKEDIDTDYTLIVKGDLDGDGVCDVLDCFVTECAQSGSITPSANQILSADSNDNKAVDITDYQQIVNKALA